MFRPLALLVSLLLAATASASVTQITFDPPRATSHTPVVAHIRGFEGGACTPHASVTVTGTKIDLLAGCGGLGIAVPMNWATDAYIGVLPPGTYDVVLNVTGPHYPLVIEDADAPFRIEPAEGSIGAHTLVTFVVLGTVTQATFDGAAAEKTGPNQFLVPPHAAGAVDVAVTLDDGTQYVAKNVFRYFDDPRDPAVFEPVLVPVFFSGAGAYGAQWVTELSTEDEHGMARSIDLGQRPHGVLLQVAHDAAPRTAFTLRVRDVSRQSESFGTDIPVVRRDAFRGRTFTILDIPNAPNYRVMLRVYSLDPNDTPYLLLTSMDSLQPLAIPRVTMTKPASPDEPAYGEADLTPLLAGAGKSRYRLTVTPPFATSEPSVWAFVTVTNNASQTITVLTPK